MKNYRTGWNVDANKLCSMQLRKTRWKIWKVMSQNEVDITRGSDGDRIFQT